MSEQQLKAFLEKVKGDSTLQEKLKAAMSPEDVVGIANEHGHEFTVDNIAELSEEELEVVAGGADPKTHGFASATNPLHCICL